ncbi:DUF4023 family protein [Paenibacillus aceris]|uniref:DUF4023 domain-containing protein n=1 Tax=Paenibacillus aceris TaxID=869555 RepID=A0ABS4I6P4_9BACL|nr:DUF4023 family protein [Paenibacillus aceris]MBP1966096.1 hypothetical protein [Paenibacillus aceris]NHW39679.1 DUF4023 family protein [Paenibacillus aceris]
MDSHFISKLHDKQKKAAKNFRTQGDGQPGSNLPHKKH